MNEMNATLDRLEARLEDQAARIDALYGLLELRGILPRGAEVGRGDGLFEDESFARDLPCGWERKPRRIAPRATGFHVGTATGV
jgi:hypothetical protein